MDTNTLSIILGTTVGLKYVPAVLYSIYEVVSIFTPGMCKYTSIFA